MLFYFNRLTPPLGVFTRLLPKRSANSIKKVIQKSVGDAGTVMDVTPRPAEGGAFVKFHSEDVNKLKAAAANGFPNRYFLFSSKARGFEVLGKPWITDIPRSLSKKVQLIPEISDEDSYELLRKYGRIRKVDNSVVTFFQMQDAITASYCTHRSLTTIDNQPQLVKLKLLPGLSWANKWKEWFKSHPRVFLPLLSLVLLSAIYAVFEPVRELMVYLKISNTLGGIESWARTNLSSSWWSFEKRRNEPMSDFNQLHAKSQQLTDILVEGASSFVAVIGPEGSGKSTIVRESLKNLENVPMLEIPCEKLKNGDKNMLHNLAASLGYRPTLLWANRALKLAEVAIKGITGQSSEFSESQDQQIERMLQTTMNVLKRLALRNFKSDKSKEETYLEQNPNMRPVVILHDFSSTDRSCELLAKFAAALVHNNIARVICVSQDTAYDKPLSAALPNRVMNVIRAEDAAPDASFEYIINMLERSKLSPTRFSKLSNSFLEPLGGRFSDLQSFGRRLLNGETPEQAMQQLILSASVEVLQLYLTESRDWSLEQAWRIVSLLAQSPEITRYQNCNGKWMSVPGNVINQPEFSVYSGPKQQSEIDNVLHAMDSAGMLSLQSVGGHVSGLKPARPIFRAAFDLLLKDKIVSSYMAMRLAKGTISRETAKIKQYEEELLKLTEISKVNKDAVKARIEYVSSQLKSSQLKIHDATKTQLESQDLLKEFKWVNQEGKRYAD